MIDHALSAGKYAAFVWPAYGVSLLGFAWMIADTLGRARRWRREADSLEKARGWPPAPGWTPNVNPRVDGGTVKTPND